MSRFSRPLHQLPRLSVGRAGFSSAAANRSTGIALKSLGAIAALSASVYLYQINREPLRADGGYAAASQLHSGKVGTINPGLFMSVPPPVSSLLWHSTASYAR